METRLQNILIVTKNVMTLTKTILESASTKFMKKSDLPTALTIVKGCSILGYF